MSKIKQGGRYILKSGADISKYEIKEITDTSILVYDIDRGLSERISKDEFDNRYNIVEDLGGSKRLFDGGSNGRN